jgi:hypothetical protein
MDLDWPTKLILIALGGAVGAAYGFYTKPIPVPRTRAGLPVTQVAATKALQACDACTALRPTLENLSGGVSISSGGDILDLLEGFV